MYLFHVFCRVGVLLYTSVFCCFRLVVTSCLVSNVWVGERRIIIIIAIIVILVFMIILVLELQQKVAEH